MPWVGGEAEGVEDAVLGTRGMVENCVVMGQIADGVLVVSDAQRTSSGPPSSKFSCQQLIDGRAPELAVLQIGRHQSTAAGLLELQNDLVAVVDEAALRDGGTLAVDRDRLAQPAVARGRRRI